MKLRLFLFGSFCLLLGAASASAAPELVIGNEALVEGGPHVAANAAAFARRLEQVAGWRPNSVAVKAFARPREALEHVRKNRSPFAILPAHQLVEGRKELKLEVLGRAVGVEGIGPSYWGITRNEPRPYTHVEKQPGLRLALTEPYDLQWVKVLFEGNVNPKDHFTYVPVTSGKEALAALQAKRADVALLYETDFRAVKPRVNPNADLAWVYTSGSVPPPAVVATRWASKGDRKKLAAALEKICKGAGGEVCARMAIMYVQAGQADSYDTIIQKYDTY